MTRSWSSSRSGCGLPSRTSGPSGLTCTITIPASPRFEVYRQEMEAFEYVLESADLETKLLSYAQEH